MKGLPPIHLATVVGRARTDRSLLLVVGAVVALTSALTSAVAPVTTTTADRAMAAAVSGAGARSTLTATAEPWFDDPSSKGREEGTVAQVRRDAAAAEQLLPAGLAAVMEPGVTTVTTSELQLLDAGPGRYLRLAYVDTADGGPAVTYDQGGPPRATRPGEPGTEDGSWPVQVAVSVEAAAALDLTVGDRVPVKDEYGRGALVRISGTFEAVDDDDAVWEVAGTALHPGTGTADGLSRTSATALVSSRSLPDLRLALPGDALTRRVLFTPDASRVRWSRAASLERSIASLQSGAGLATGGITWDSLLGSVLQDGRAQVSSARGQAQVLVVGLLACALLVLVLAAQLLVRRRADSVAMARERGASLLGIAGELAVESLLVALLGAAAGLLATSLLAGSVGWGWSVPVVVAATLTAPVLGAVLASGVGGARRVPANRGARRAAVRAVQLRRIGAELGIAAAAVLSMVALRQRGVVGGVVEGGNGIVAAGAVTWSFLAGAVVLLRLLPPALRWALRGTRRSPGGVAFVVAARLTRTGARALPVLVACTAVAQVTFGVALVGTARDGQAVGALSAVGGDARLDADPDPLMADAAAEAARVPGNVAVAGRVQDGVRLSAQGGAATVRLVVVDAADFADLRAAAGLDTPPGLAGLAGSATAANGAVPALLRGGPDGLRDVPRLLWEGTAVPLDLVGTAPDVDASADPVLVVDATALARAGVVAPPDTVWAVGPGAASSLADAAGSVSGADPLVTYSGLLEERRDAPLPSAVVGLAATSSALLVLLALLGTVLAAAADAPARRQSLGRLRALGMQGADLRRGLVGELIVPVAVSGVVGLVLGAGCAHLTLGRLALERLTGAPEPPDPVVPWWCVLAVVALVACAAAVALLEWRRVRRTPLAVLLRS